MRPVIAVHSGQNVRDRDIGQAGSLGHESVHGTHDDKQRRWGKYQSHIGLFYGSNSIRSYEDCGRESANHFGLSLKTIKRHMMNWNNS